MLRLEGNHVVLRPLRPEDLDALCEGSWRLDDRAQPHGPPTLERFERLIERSGRWRRGRLDLGIEASGRLVGAIQALRGRAWNLPAGVAQLGIAIFDPADRGQGIGSTAVALLTGWLFEHMRGFIAAHAGREDCALYALTKDTWHGRVTEQ